MAIVKYPWPWILLAAAWMAAVGVGAWYLDQYANTPGESAAAPSVWPPQSRIERAKTPFQLVLFVHPRCPCSEATLSELARLMARCQGRLHARVMFFRPSTAAVPWTTTDLWHTAAVIPGVKVGWDEDGIEAHRFGARTSGATYLYDPEGRLRYRGGITVSRGHQGDNLGSRSIFSVVSEEEAGRDGGPVFGCPLQAPATPPEDTRP